MTFDAAGLELFASTAAAHVGDDRVPGPAVGRAGGAG